MCISCVKANEGQEDVEMEVLLNMFGSEARFLRVHNGVSVPERQREAAPADLLKLR